MKGPYAMCTLCALPYAQRKLVHHSCMSACSCSAANVHSHDPAPCVILFCVQMLKGRANDNHPSLKLQKCRPLLSPLFKLDAISGQAWCHFCPRLHIVSSRTETVMQPRSVVIQHLPADVSQPGKHACRSLPRVGVHLGVPKACRQVDWYGKGPHECYPDRKTGAWLRRYHVANADELHVPYIYPGAANFFSCSWLETGYHRYGLLLVHQLQCTAIGLMEGLLSLQENLVAGQTSGGSQQPTKMAQALPLLHCQSRYK